MWSNPDAIVRNSNSEQVGLSKVGEVKRHTMVGKSYQRLKMEQVLYKLERPTEDQRMSFMNLPDFISGRKVDPIVQKIRNFKGTQQERKELEAKLRRDQELGGNPTVDINLIRIDDRLEIAKLPTDLDTKIRQVHQQDDMSELVPMCSTRKVAYFRGREFQGNIQILYITLITIPCWIKVFRENQYNCSDRHNEKMTEVNWWAANINALAHVHSQLAQTEPTNEQNIRSSQILGSMLEKSVDAAQESPAHEYGQAYYHPANLAPQLFFEPAIFAKPANFLGLWWKLVRGEDVGHLTDEDPKR